MVQSASPPENSNRDVSESRPGPWIAALSRRCPRCLQGRIFCGLFQMNSKCPNCGLTFDREHGYFTGAMYVSYSTLR